MSIFIVMFVLSSVFLFMILYIHYWLFTSRYWSRRHVPHLKPRFLLGNVWKASLTQNTILAMKNLYIDHSDKKILGFWFFHNPILLVNDLNLIRHILIKDLEVFNDRPIFYSEIDPLSSNLIFLSGKRWKNMRVKLTPAFTSVKIKMLFPIMLQCSNQLRRHLAEGGNEIEVKDLMQRFSTDFMVSCTLGIEANSLKDPSSEFLSFGKRFLRTNLRHIAFNIFRNIHPKLIKLFWIRLIPKEVSNFFINIVRDTIAQRRANNLVRNDFLQLLIDLMNEEKIKDLDKANYKTDEDTFDEIQAAAQYFIFFIAAIESSSTALSYGLYELALHTDIQAKLQKEIDSVLSDGEITYDKMFEMQYLDMVVHEIFRKYPTIGYIGRQTNREYRFPEVNVIVDKGTKVCFSALGIHHNPKYYPNPERFDPERFSPEEKKKRDPMTYLPFLHGPRNCIGSRFGIMQIKFTLLTILREHSVAVSEKTQIPPKVDVRSVFLWPVGGIHLTVTKRTQY